MPCRKCDPEEGRGLILTEVDPSKNALIQYIEYPFMGQLEVVSLGVLIPYNGSCGEGIKELKGNDCIQRDAGQEFNNNGKWSPHICSLYSKQLEKDYTKLYIRTQFLHMGRILDNVTKATTESDEVVDTMARSSSDGHSDCAAQGSQLSSSVAIPLNVETKICKKTVICDEEPFDDEIVSCDSHHSDTGHKTEMIRPGDILNYYSHLHVKGDSRGFREATVLSVNPRGKPILVLDNGEFLPSDTEIKRLKVMHRGKLIDHNSIYRRIESFKLRKASQVGIDNVAAGILKESERLGGILQRATEEFQKKAVAEGFAPYDLMNKFKTDKKERQQNLEGELACTPSSKKGKTPSKSNPTSSVQKQKTDATLNKRKAPVKQSIPHTKKKNQKPEDNLSEGEQPFTSSRKRIFHTVCACV